jgi:hypothetical protein
VPNSASHDVNPSVSFCREQTLRNEFSEAVKCPGCVKIRNVAQSGDTSTLTR